MMCNRWSPVCRATLMVAEQAWCALRCDRVLLCVPCGQTQGIRARRGDCC